MVEDSPRPDAGFVTRQGEGLSDIAIIDLGLPTLGGHSIGKVFWGAVGHRGTRYWRCIIITEKGAELALRAFPKTR
jgi:hypothetical protein